MEGIEQNQRKKLEELAFGPNANWDQKPSIQNERARDFYKEKLWQIIQDAKVDPFPHSHAPANPDLAASHHAPDIISTYKKYEIVLPEYMFNPKTDDSKYFFGGDPNFAYKLRLNVAVKEAPAVSEYLKANDICHKFLKGADSPGEIFTIYTGSKDRTDALAQILSQDLDSKLCKPVGEKEVEFAPNVIGYFNSGSTPFGLTRAGIQFSRYPYRRAIPFIAGDELSNLPPELIYSRSYDELARIFGTYFYGTEGPSFDQLLSKLSKKKGPQKENPTFDQVLRKLSK